MIKMVEKVGLKHGRGKIAMANEPTSLDDWLVRLDVTGVHGRLVYKTSVSLMVAENVLYCKPIDRVFFS